MTFAMIITLTFPFTPQAEPLRLDSDQRYTEARCQELGKELAQWMAQDGVRAEYRCVQITKPIGDTLDATVKN